MRAALAMNQHENAMDEQGEAEMTLAKTPRPRAESEFKQFWISGISNPGKS
jgi:hypothetical protein